MQPIRQICLGVGIIALVALAVGVAISDPSVCRYAALASAVTLPIGFGAVPILRPYQFTAWIVAGVVAAMIFPAYFLQIGNINLRNKTLILLIMQVVMFGMGGSFAVSC